MWITTSGVFARVDSVTYNISQGSPGGSNNELQKNESSAFAGTGLFSTVDGDLTLGSGLAGSSRTITAAGSTPPVDLRITPSGVDSNLYLSHGTTSGYVYIGSSTATGTERRIGVAGSQSTIDLSLTSKGTSSFVKIWDHFSVQPSGVSVGGKVSIGNGPHLSGGSVVHINDTANGSLLDLHYNTNTISQFSYLSYCHDNSSSGKVTTGRIGVAMTDNSATSLDSYMLFNVITDNSTDYPMRLENSRAYIGPNANSTTPSYTLHVGGTMGITGAITLTAGVRQTFAPNTTTAGFNFGSVSSYPSSGAAGDAVYNSTNQDIGVYVKDSFKPIVTKIETILSDISSITGDCKKAAEVYFSTFSLGGSGLTYRGYDNAGYGTLPDVVLDGAINDFFNISILVTNQTVSSDTVCLVALGEKAN
jgi:hypothetical protein